ncbi:MAG TPA: FAD-dependent oxidoreductase [Dehalococcoidales bacterium]|nr:FAD-dependent oxidoreductase [Dehalococcoidales bacterium]
MNEAFEVIVVGGGPAGISAACVLADAGIKTVVIERGESPGAKNTSGGVLYGYNLAQILPDYIKRGCPVERNIVESRIWYLSKTAGYSIGYRDSIFAAERKHNVFTVGRARFDRWFATQAKQKGCLIIPGTTVIDLLRDADGKVSGVATNRQDGEIRAKVVLLADGINSALAAKTGFRKDVHPEHVALAVKETIELDPQIIEQRFAVSSEDGVTTEVLGEMSGGMDGVAIIYTNKSSISIAVGANLAQFAKTKIKPYELLEAYKQHPMVSPLIAGGKPIEYTAHWLSEGGYDTIPQLVGDGYLITGDSAMLFNALHREGHNLAMASGKMAAEAIQEAVKAGDFTRNGLSSYVRKMQESFVMKDMKKYRRFGSFLFGTPQVFNELPQVAQFAAREMLTVDGVHKKQKQKLIMAEIRRKVGLLNIARIALRGFRAVR